MVFPDGSSRDVGVEAGSITFMIGHTHIGEIIGDTYTDVIFVELKGQ